jgi:6-hydroxycyclohex-1-ene-1-carbonyl-CoA dehydrogenase
MSQAWQWQMTAPETPLTRVEVDIPAPGPEEAVVKVAGCGVCHTDIGFLYGGVRTRHALPLALGHEVSGYVVDAGEAHRALIGKAVVVPAVVPCGECEACRKGHGNICAKQQMPGNDVHGGFASHLVVPARGLCVVPVKGEGPDATVGDTDLTLAEVSVMADAITTPYQAAVRAGIEEGDLSIVVGLGGVGGYAAQIARALGAHVVGVEPDAGRRDAMARWCDAGTLDPAALDERALRQEVARLGEAAGARKIERKIFECSGTGAGQRTAYSLLGPGAVLSVVGFTMEKIEVRLSNLMAHDARAIGSWGCVPERYPEVLQLILDGRIEIRPFVSRYPDTELNGVLERVRDHQEARRPVIVPGQH